MDKIGRFTSRNGHTYAVKFSGDWVVEAELTLGVPPVVISMAAGEHKYCGFKSTTATVNIVTDVPLTDLYASTPMDIRLTVTDETSGKVEFDGYVVPFAFDQPYSGRLDIVTVNAVDVLTARKDVKYENVGETHGIDRKASLIVQEICERAVLKRIVQHLNFNDAADMMASASPLDVKVAQAGFLQDEVSDAEALSAICKFFGYTAHVIGDTLYLYDEYCLNYSHYDANVYELGSDGIIVTPGWHLVGHYKGSTASPLSKTVIGKHRDVSLSIERAYDGVQISLEGVEQSVLTPDVCAPANMDENTDSLGTATREVTIYANPSLDVIPKYVQERTPLRSKVMTTGLYLNGELQDAWSQVNGDPMKDGAERWVNGAIPMRLENTSLEAASYGGEGIAVETSAYDKSVVWIRMQMNTANAVLGVQKEATRYSHTGGYVRLECSLFETLGPDWAEIDKKLEVNGVHALPIIAIVNGEKNLRSDYKESGTEWVQANVSGILLMKNYQLLPTKTSIAKHTSDVVVPVDNDGQLYVMLQWAKDSNTSSLTNIYVESLKVTAWGDDVNTSCAGLRKVFSNRAGGEFLKASTMLTTRAADYNAQGESSGVNARAAVVPGGVFAAPYLVGYKTACPLTGVYMEHLAARYEYHRPSYKMTAEGYVKPYAAVDWGACYTVEAYDWDIYNNETTITID